MIDPSRKKNKAYVSFRMSKDIVEEIDRLAELNGRNRSQEIIFALRSYLESQNSNIVKNPPSSENYLVTTNKKISSEVKDELLSALYDTEIKERIKKIIEE